MKLSITTIRNLYYNCGDPRKLLMSRELLKGYIADLVEDNELFTKEEDSFSYTKDIKELNAILQSS